MRIILSLVKKTLLNPIVEMDVRRGASGTTQSMARLTDHWNLRYISSSMNCLGSGKIITI